MQNHFERYIEINKTIATLEAEKELIAEKILPEVKESPEGKIQLEAGTFSTSTTRKWTYPQTVKDI